MHFRYVETFMEANNWCIHNKNIFSCIPFFSYYWIRGSLTQSELFIFIERASIMHGTAYILIHTWKCIVGLTFELCWFDSVLDISIHEHCAQHLKMFSSVVMHISMMDMHMFLPYPCQMLYWTYDHYVAWRNFYMSQISDWPFHQTFCFACYNFDLFLIPNKAHVMIIMINEQFLQIWNTHNHTWIFIERSYFWIGVE